MTMDANTPKTPAAETLVLNDKSRGRVWLTIRDGVVIGATGSEPGRFIGLTVESARHTARYGADKRGAVTRGYALVQMARGGQPLDE